MLRKLALFIFFISSFPCYAATVVNDGSINWNGNWQTTIQTNAFHASTNLTPDSSTTVYSVAWDGSGSNTNIGVILYIGSEDGAITTGGTHTITLQQDLNDDGDWADATDRASTTLAYSDNSITTGSYQYWFFKYSASHTETAGTANYRIKLSATNGINDELHYRADSVTTTALGAMRVLSTTASIAASDVAIVAGYCTACTTTPTAATVTVNVNSNGTSYGNIIISSNATLAYTTAAATTTYLEVAGNIYIGANGIFNIGTTGTPIPSDSTATLELETTSADRTVYVYTDNSKLSMQGYPFTGNVWRTNTTDSIAAIGDRTVQVSDNVSTAGWKAGDKIIISTTSSATYQGSEVATISSVGTSPNSITIDADWSTEHLSGAEIANMTRNVKIVAGSSSNDARFYMQSTTSGDVNIDYVWFYDLPEPGAEANIVQNVDGALFDIDYSVIDSCQSPINIINDMTDGDYFDWSNNLFFVDGHTTSSITIDASNGAGATTTYHPIFYIRDSSFIELGNATYGAINADSIILYVENSNFYGRTNDTSSVPAGIITGDEGADVYIDNCKFYALEAGIYPGGQGNPPISHSTFYITNSYFGSDGTNDIDNSSYDIYMLQADTQVYAYESFFNTSNVYSSPLEASYTTFDNRFETLPFIAFTNRSVLGSDDQYNMRAYHYGYISDYHALGYTAADCYGGSGNCAWLYSAETSAGNELHYEFKIPVTASTNPQLKFYVKEYADGNCTLTFDVIDTDNITKLTTAESVTKTTSWSQHSAASFTPTRTGLATVRMKYLNAASSCGSLGIDSISIVSGGSTLTADMDYWRDGVPVVWFEGGGTGGTGSVSVSTNF